MKKIYSVILLLAVMLSSCTKDETDIITDDNSKAPALAQTRSGNSAVEYEKMPNPYALSVMQGVYDSYKVSKKLEPTDLYVRFLPQDSLQLNTLKYNYNLELFDYPLDIEIP